MLKKPKSLLVANWKMNLTRKQTEQLVADIKKQTKVLPHLEVVVCPSFIDIPYVAEQLRRSDIKIGAQDVAWLDSGSFTGEISPVSLKNYGVEYVIVGHSERRGLLNETDEIINKKLKACFKNGLQPILCVGETFEQRQSGQKDYIIAKQVQAALQDIVINKYNQIIIAYEPVWVIGSGQAVNPEEARQTAAVIRAEVFDIYHNHEKSLDEYLRILYGGSVNSGNIIQFVKDNISGVLVGGASLDAVEFSNLLTKIN